MSTAPRVQPPKLVSAGAGAGKTYWLVEHVVSRVRQGVPLERIAVVTFTEAAAAELQERLRGRLLECGMPEYATRVDSAAVCTIHRFALTLLQRYPLAAGLPPEPIVLDETQSARMLHQHIEALLGRTEHADAQALRRLTNEWLGPALGLPLFGRGEGDTPVGRLRDLVKATLEKARSLGMRSDGLAREAELAAERARSAAGKPGNPLVLQNAFLRALDDALSFVAATPEPPTKTDLPLYEILGPMASGVDPVHPDRWLDAAVRIASRSADGGSKKFAASQPLVAAAQTACAEHPEMRERIAGTVRDLLAVSHAVLRSMEAEKARIGAVDFEDMQALALDLLTGRGPSGVAYAPLVARAFRFAVVDEFQDTSPLQYQLFEALRQHGTELVFVGDVKQAIYRFRTADPALFAALLRRADEGAQKAERLDRSRRSRPELVSFANDLFAALFAHGETPFEPLGAENAYARGANAPTGACIEVLRHTRIEKGELKGAKAHALAGRLRELVSGPNAVRVLDRATGEERPARWSDVAILGRRNATLATWSQQLSARGIPVRLAPGSLFDTLEVRLALAWLRMLASPQDGASVASVLVSELYGISQHTMVTLRLAGLLGYPKLVLDVASKPDSPFTLAPHEMRAIERCSADLTACRDALRHLPLPEAVEFALERVELGLRTTLDRDEDEAARAYANLRCIAERAHQLAAQTERALDLTGATGATLENLLLELEADREAGVRQRDGDPARDAVQLVTLHASKGLEYPIVVLDALADEVTVRLPRVEVTRPADDGVFLGRDALAHSGLRVLPKVGPRELAERLGACEQGEDAERGEWLRLLYVGVTRAREHLVLLWPEAGKTQGTTRLARDLLTERTQAPPAAGGTSRWALAPGATAHTVLVTHATAPPATGLVAPTDRTGVMSALAERLALLPAQLAPAPARFGTVPRLSVVSPTELCRVAECPEVPRLSVLYPDEHHLVRDDGVEVSLHRIPSARAQRQALLDALAPSELGHLLHEAIEHAPLLSDEDPNETVDALLRAHPALEVPSELLRAFLVRAIEATRRALAELGATEVVARELPFAAPVGGTLLHGSIDLLCRGPSGLHVIDLKAHVLDEPSIAKWARHYGPQLDAYALALTTLLREPIAGMHLLLPSSGYLATVRAPFDAGAAAQRTSALATELAADQPGPRVASDCAGCGWRALCRVGRHAS